MKQQFRHLLTKFLAALACLTLFATAMLSYSPAAHAAANGAGPFYYSASFTAYCQQWYYYSDGAGDNIAYTPSNGTQNCADADWYLSNGSYPTNHTCDYFVFVPGYAANASAVVPGLFDTSGNKFYGNTINEIPYTYQYVYIGTFSNINHVNIGDNDGETGTYLGLGSGNGSLLVQNCN